MSLIIVNPYIVSPPASAGALVAFSTLNTGATANGVSAAINTTGASLLVVMVGRFFGTGVSVSLSDNKGNTFTAGTNRQTGSIQAQMFYCANPVVGSGHTFTLSGFGGGQPYGTAICAAFSGIHTSPTPSAEVGALLASSTTIQPGAQTPAQDNSLIVCGLGCGSDWDRSGTSINSSFTKIAIAHGTPGQQEGSGLAYKFQGTAASENPTWTVTGATEGVIAVQRSFKPA